MEVDEIDSIVSYIAPPGADEANLVQPRSESIRAVVSTRNTDKATPDDLVALASQLTMARELVKGRACDRLRGIAQQMEQLQLVLEEAARDEDLHSVACNMQKQPGRVYHLYRRSDGYRYFSLLAPHEWGCTEKEGEYVGSFRLEFDRSWTDMTQAEEKDRQFAQFQNIIKAGPSMLGWRNN